MVYNTAKVRQENYQNSYMFLYEGTIPVDTNFAILVGSAYKDLYMMRLLVVRTSGACVDYDLISDIRGLIFRDRIDTYTGSWLNLQDCPILINPGETFNFVARGANFTGYISEHYGQARKG